MMGFLDAKHSGRLYRTSLLITIRTLQQRHQGFKDALLATRCAVKRFKHCGALQVMVTLEHHMKQQLSYALTASSSVSVQEAWYAVSTLT